MQVAQFIETVETRRDIKIARPGEIAWRMCC